MKLGSLLAHLRELEQEWAAALQAAAQRHCGDHDVYHQCHTFAVTADNRLKKLEPLAQRYEGRPEWTTAIGVGSDDLLEELRALYLRTEGLAITWTMAAQAAKALRDQELLSLARDCQSETAAQASWFSTRIKTGAPQALVVG